MRMQILQPLPRLGLAVRAGALVLLVTLAACNLSVDNPDRVQDPLLNALGPKAVLYAGCANRLFGGNMCEAALDGGAPSEYKDYFRRAEGALAGAIAVAGAAGAARVSTAATAARASVRLMLGDDAGAAS